MNAGDAPMVTTPHTHVMVDATELARFLQRMTDYAEVHAADEDLTNYTRAFSGGAAQAYRAIADTVLRMVEQPDDSPFVVPGAPVIIASRPVKPTQLRGV